MSELDDFRPRIVNWARVYRGHTPIRMSPYYKETEPKEGRAEPVLEPDYRDAEFIDECITSLRQFSAEFDDVFLVLKAEYLVRYSSSDFESEEEAFKAKRKKAAYAQIFVWRYDENLRKAETMLMSYVARKERSSLICTGSSED